MLRLLVILCCTLACSPVRAQAILKLWDPAYVSVRPGASVEIILIAEVQRGYAVIAHDAEDSALQPLTLRFRPLRQVVVGTPRYPAGQPTHVDADRRKVSAHMGRLQIAVPLTVSKQAQAGELTLLGDLRFQACVELRCSATRTLPVNLTLDVLPATR